ncbi:hypothetical protein VZT92_007390 [Zoarces viviparus]|uniref:Uncharacterized protein n=1 Tax=Zoarces viviparus TaxID=48416 RepID=A0AAW1FJN4_ZOAVI
MGVDWFPAEDGERITAQRPVLLSTAARQTAGEPHVSSVHHSYLVAAAPQDHPSPFPHSLSPRHQHQLSLNQSNYRPPNGPQSPSTCLPNLPDPLGAFGLSIPHLGRA